MFVGSKRNSYQILFDYRYVLSEEVVAQVLTDNKRQQSKSEKKMQTKTFSMAFSNNT